MKITAGRAALFVWIALANGSLCQAQTTSASVPMKLYTDEVGGISLQYPTVWILSKSAVSYFPSVIARSGEPLQAVFSFSPKGNFYEHTTLVGLQFLYRRQTALNWPACESILSTNRENSQGLDHLTIHGRTFAHLSTGDAGMMKSVSQEGYATWQDGTCYLFEADLSQVAKGTDDEKTRDLTSAEVRALRKHLNDILESVVFNPPKAGD